MRSSGVAICLTEFVCVFSVLVIHVRKVRKRLEKGIEIEALKSNDISLPCMANYLIFATISTKNMLDFQKITTR